MPYKPNIPVYQRRRRRFLRKAILLSFVVLCSIAWGASNVIRSRGDAQSDLPLQAEEQWAEEASPGAAFDPAPEGPEEERALLVGASEAAEPAPDQKAVTAPPSAPKKPVPTGLYVVIEKSRHKLTVMRDGAKVKEYGVAVGKNQGDKQRVGDMRTPEGSFTVQQIQNASSWTHDFKDGKGQIAGAYGPRFIRLKTPPWTGIGIHGTHAPESIGTNVTEGCIRLKNSDLLEFEKTIKIGTVVQIRS